MTEPEDRTALALKFAEVFRERAAKIGRDPLLYLCEVFVMMDRKAVEEFVKADD